MDVKKRNKEKRKLRAERVGKLERESIDEAPEVSNFMDVTMWLWVSLQTIGLISTLTGSWNCSLRR